jgi:hypothetical protein
MTASVEPPLINQLIDTIQSLIYNPQLAAGEPRETEPTHIHQTPVYQ